MRVISGSARGRSLFLSPKSKARPTSDRIKEALFNILASVAGRSFLDVFAGAGSVGIEALSRGAASAVFVEKDAVHCDAIKKNLVGCGFLGNAEICCAEVKKAVPLLEKKGLTFDIVFADPPYEMELVGETLELFAAGKLSVPGGMIIFQHSRREDPDWSKAGGLIKIDQRRYGDTLLTFLQSPEQ